mmetsp:Transcript_13168/g.24748  ORF Transcript_13168/g.24748 Transcript_13168/m.24748 type:complete len:241 (-) Transcript_13168:829-1551(-)
MIRSSCLGNSTSQNASIGSPYTILGSIYLVNRPRVPNKHITWHSPKLCNLILICFQSLLLNVYKHSLFTHNCIKVRSLEIYRSSIISRCLIHGNPKTKTFLPCNRTILIILMPLESLVRIHHEQIRRNTNLVCTSTLCQHMSHSRMVIKVGKGLISLPDVSLNVIIQFRSCPSKCPKVRFVHLIHGGFSKVVHPFFVKDALDVYDTVSFEGLDLFLCDEILFRSTDAFLDAVGEGELWVL